LANYSESFFIDQGETPLQIADPSYKSESASGYDYGFKGALLNERLTYTVSGYYINRENVRVTDLEATLKFFALLGLEETHRKESAAGRFTLVFVAAPPVQPVAPAAPAK